MNCPKKDRTSSCSTIDFSIHQLNVAGKGKGRGRHSKDRFGGRLTWWMLIASFFGAVLSGMEGVEGVPVLVCPYSGSTDRSIRGNFSVPQVGVVDVLDPLPNDGQAVEIQTRKDAICHPMNHPSNGSNALPFNPGNGDITENNGGTAQENCCACAGGNDPIARCSTLAASKCGDSAEYTGDLISSGYFIPCAGQQCDEYDASKRAKQTGVLKKCKALATLSDKSTSRIIDAMTYMKLPLGATICQKGNDANCMYVLMSGTCVVTIQNRKVETLSEFSELDVFGEAALFGTGTKRSDTVTTASDVVEVLVLSGAALTELTESGDVDGTSVENIRQISKDRSRLNVQKRLQRAVTLVQGVNGGFNRVRE